MNRSSCPATKGVEIHAWCGAVESVGNSSSGAWLGKRKSALEVMLMCSRLLMRRKMFRLPLCCCAAFRRAARERISASTGLCLHTCCGQKQARFYLARALLLLLRVSGRFNAKRAGRHRQRAARSIDGRNREREGGGGCPAVAAGCSLEEAAPPPSSRVQGNIARGKRAREPPPQQNTYL